MPVGLGIGTWASRCHRRRGRSHRIANASERAAEEARRSQWRHISPPNTLEQEVRSMISSSRAGKKVPRRQGTRSKRRRLAAERRLALSTRQKWVSGRVGGRGGGGAFSGKLLLITTFCSRRSSLDHDWPGIRVRRSGGSPRSCFAWTFVRFTFQFAVQAVPGTCAERRLVRV